jgi:hypothetical protein
MSSGKENHLNLKAIEISHYLHSIFYLLVESIIVLLFTHEVVVQTILGTDEHIKTVFSVDRATATCR